MTDTHCASVLLQVYVEIDFEDNGEGDLKEQAIEVAKEKVGLDFAEGVESMVDRLEKL